MTPQQKFYQEKMRKRGWIGQDGEIVWPSDERERRAMARQIFGLELVSSLDYRVEDAEDEIYGTFEAPWSDPDRVSEEEARRRAVFASMTDEQKRAALDLVHHFGKILSFGFCCHIDQFDGGAITMLLSGTNPQNPEEQLRIQPGDFLDMHDEQLQWLEDFSRIYGKDDEAEPGSPSNAG